MRIQLELASMGSDAVDVAWGGGGGQGRRDFKAPCFVGAGCGQAPTKATSDLPARRQRRLRAPFSSLEALCQGRDPRGDLKTMARVRGWAVAWEGVVALGQGK